MTDTPAEDIDLCRLVTREHGTIFIPLPRQLWKPASGTCCCTWCKSHPDCRPMWDTLVVGEKKTSSYDFTHLVHYPELANPLGAP